MTRLCRAQYEDDDIAEANVVSRRDDGQPADLSSNVDLTNGEAMRIDPRDRTMTRLTQKFRGLRLPAWINFSYSTAPHRARILRRKPIPFGPFSQTFSRLGSLDNPNPPEESVPPDIETAVSMPVQTSPITEGNSVPVSTPPPPLGPVNNHPPIVSWNDEPRVNTPYDNPFYTKAISDILWLPRDPFGILDLDDTVTLRVSLTSEPSAGQLSLWHEDVSSPLPSLSLSPPCSPVQAGFVPSIAASDDRHSILMANPVQQYSGDEDIELPPAIAARVADLENEDDVQKAPTDRPPSLFARRKSSAKDKESLVGMSRRPGSRRGTLDDDRRPTMGFRSVSSYSGEQDSRSTSFWSAVEQQRDRSASVITRGTSKRPPAFAPAAFASTMVPTNTPDLSQPSSRTDIAPTKQVTTQEAVANEVIAEEHEAAQERFKEEQADAERAKGKNSWVTAWIYDRIQ